jgi:hypothetical protein
MAAARAVREFAVPGDPWPVVEGWAQRQGYRAIEQGGDRRAYRKGSGFWAGSRIVEIRTADGRVHLEAWVASNLVARIGSLFILPREITIESGGMKGVLPRKMGRNEVNDLLQAFGQQPIS